MATPGELESLVEAHSCAVEAYFDALGQTLVYAPSSSIGNAVRQCWDAVDSCSQLLRADSKRIINDPRYATLDSEARRRRPAAFLANAFGEELFGSLLVCGCHHALVNEESGAGLLQESEERLCQSLSSIAEGVVIMLVSRLLHHRLSLAHGTSFTESALDSDGSLHVLSQRHLRRWLPSTGICQMGSGKAAGVLLSSSGSTDRCFRPSGRRATRRRAGRTLNTDP